MEKFLSEEKYQKNKKKISLAALIILIIGLLIGGSLITVGILKTKELKDNTQNRSETVIQSDIDAIRIKIDNLETEIRTLNREEDTIYKESGSNNDSYYAKEDEIIAKNKDLNILNDKLSDYNFELKSVQNGWKENNLVEKYAGFYIVAAFVIFTSFIIAAPIYLFTKRREITAFSAQQVIPVAQEGLEKVAPAMGELAKETMKEMAPAYGDMAKEISKGIKEGLKEDDKNN